MSETSELKSSCQVRFIFIQKLKETPNRWILDWFVFTRRQISWWVLLSVVTGDGEHDCPSAYHKNKVDPCFSQ